MGDPTTTFERKGSFAEIRELYIKAATYDAAFAITADRLFRRDRHARNVTVALASITSLSLFGSLFVQRPELWAKLVVFIMSGTAAVLTALRQEAQWVQRSRESRDAHLEWLKQRNTTLVLARRICDGETITEKDLQAVEACDVELTGKNPDMHSDLYAEFERKNSENFDGHFHL